LNLTVKDEVIGKDGGLDLLKAAPLMHIYGPKFMTSEKEILPRRFTGSK